MRIMNHVSRHVRAFTTNCHVRVNLQRASCTPFDDSIYITQTSLASHAHSATHQ